MKNQEVDGQAPQQHLLRRIPKMDRLLTLQEFQELTSAHPRKRVVDSLRRALENLRQSALRNGLREEELEALAIHQQVQKELERQARPYYEQVINATGVILHTGLGRAVLAPEAALAVRDLSVRPQRVEIDVETGDRGGRDRGCGQLIEELVGCEAATVVNNNAAATILILAALARGKRVLLSRGELVEIGGSFRIPEIMSESGAILAEVGTTNRTHAKDYRQALDSADLEAECGMILKVHTSNYRVVGFTQEVDIATLVEIGRPAGIPVVHDMGSGCLIDLAARGCPGEELARQSIAAGADLVCFSGDKLLGGPQAGIIAGKAEMVERCRKHPLMRAMRPGRLIYTALEATLRLYLEEDAASRIPILRQLLEDTEVLRRRAQRLARRLGKIDGLTVDVVESLSQAGSGSLPTREYPSWAVRLGRSEENATELAHQLRRGTPPILARVNDDAVLLDLRTLDPKEFPAIEKRLGEISTNGE
ncbi:MAG: L-seryl-tRNA(Sec) selenium transferase [Deltaproteobacteria bacterium]|nr:L-seryl-tRNA(Sec) selenium transferase [Deltaproteobacteria bacterium]